MSGRTAVILFNLGGPDRLAAVRPFLFNLFNDRAIIRLPQPFRWLLAQFISRRRAPFTQDIYRQIGNKSPLLDLTGDQAAALEGVLNENGAGGTNYRCFIAMRYWHPFARETVRKVKNYAPDRIVLLPLYPQYSTTTSQSSLDDWQRQARAAGLDSPAVSVCCYPLDDGFVAAHAAMIAGAIGKNERLADARLLFSAHGLPQKIVDAGDPYEWQVRRTVDAVLGRLKGAHGIEITDWCVCFQSRVGPMKWLEPSTEAEIARAGRDGKALILTPIAFVSEHSETLVELDREYADLSASANVPAYVRIPALGGQADFICGLAGIVRQAENRLGSGAYGPCCGDGGRLCPQGFSGCPAREEQA